MPGLSQLKQFNKDLLAIGDEVTIRAARGEKPVEVHIPKEVEDKNDSEDFVLGMPEIEAEVDNSPVDEDLSDLAGLANPASTSSNDSTEPSPTFEAPDLSDLLNPIAISDDGGSGSSSDMPDLSMFEDAPVEEEEEIAGREEDEFDCEFEDDEYVQCISMAEGRARAMEKVVRELEALLKKID